MFVLFSGSGLLLVPYWLVDPLISFGWDWDSQGAIPVLPLHWLRPPVWPEISDRLDAEGSCRFRSASGFAGVVPFCTWYTGRFPWPAGIFWTCFSSNIRWLSRCRFRSASGLGRVASCCKWYTGRFPWPKCTSPYRIGDRILGRLPVAIYLSAKSWVASLWR